MAARAAVCLPALSLKVAPPEDRGGASTAEARGEAAASGEGKAAEEGEAAAEEEVDECLFWSPTGSGACLQWASEEEAWRKRRFERVQMEGTRDPRRGGSGTTR